MWVQLNIIAWPRKAVALAKKDQSVTTLLGIT